METNTPDPLATEQPQAPVPSPKELALAGVDRVLAVLAVEIASLPQAPGHTAVCNARASLQSVQHLLACDRALVVQG